MSDISLCNITITTLNVFKNKAYFWIMNNLLPPIPDTTLREFKVD